jgi:DtxR family transcriptional regulator, Mn-dependent transcriptional regulator
MTNIISRTTSPGETSSSVEDYLEAIFELARVASPVRVTDLSEHLGVSKPSVSAAAKRLVEAGWAIHERYGGIQLTEKGRERAKVISSRHQLLLRFLVHVLGVDRSTAEEDACHLEHFLGEETANRLHRFVTFLTEGEWQAGDTELRFDALLRQGKTHAALVKGWRNAVQDDPPVVET